MFETVDIIIFGIFLAFCAYILIDSYILGKKIDKRRKEFNDERQKAGKSILDDSTYIGSSVDSDAAEKFRSTIFKNMGGMMN